MSHNFDSRFQVTGQFETSAPNDCKITLNPTRSNVPHICYKCPWFPNFSPFHSRFCNAGHFKKSALNPPKMPVNPTLPHTGVTIIKESQNPKFQSVLLNDQLFWRYRPSWNKFTEWPINDLGHYEQRYAIYVLLLSHNPKFHPLFLYDHPFSRYKVVNNRKCTKWPWSFNS